jgi:hypothetical protein
MASEGRLCSLAEVVCSAEYTVECVEGIIPRVSIFSRPDLSYISVHAKEVLGL